MGALRTQEPRISGRRRLNTPPFPEIGGSGDVFPHLRDRGSPSQSYADGDIPLTGSHGLPGVKRVRSTFGHRVRVNDRSRVSSGRDWNIHMRIPTSYSRISITGANPAFGFKRSTSFLGKFLCWSRCQHDQFSWLVHDRDHDHRIECSHAF